MQEKIKISAVSYLNSKPFMYGLFMHDIDQVVDLSLDIPSVCARKLIDGEVDLGLVPVAVIPEIANAKIISDFCIGTEGAVKTVCIYAQKPIEELTTLYLDYHSRTSVALAQLLLKEYWQISPNLVPATAGYIQKIQDKVGGVIIGDRTIGLSNQFAYTYDLGEIWQKLTGLPFVFAAWVSNKPLPDSFIQPFNKALTVGVNRLAQVAKLFQSSYPQFDVLEYYSKYISYTLDKAKYKALHRFLTGLASLSRSSS